MNQPQPEYQEVQDVLDVPRHAGVEGFLLAIRSILKMPRVTGIAIDNRGKVTFTRYVRKEEPRKQIEIDFETVAPSAVIRNGRVIEVDVEAHQGNAAACLAHMFLRAANDHMFPVGWIVSPNSRLAAWHTATTQVNLPSDSAYGLPIHRDRHIPDESLILACAYGPDAALVDVQLAYKITMPEPARMPEPEVEETPS